jgi:hypothetical protein
MWYTPYLRVRHAVIVYAYIAVGISLAAIALRFWPGAEHASRAVASVRVDLSMILSIATAFVGGLATVLGLNLAAENDGHLELAWTKPVSREGYALGVFGVDIVAMAIAILFTTLLAAIVIDVYAGFQVVHLSNAGDSVEALLYCGLPLLVYAWVTALSASLKRNRGAAAAIFWPLMLALALLSLIPVAAVHAVATTLNLFNPVVLYTTSHGSSDVQNGGATAHLAVHLAPVWGFAWGWAVAALLLAASVFQWRRLQL